MAGEIISERRATSNRNGGRDHPGIPGDFSRNQHFERYVALAREAAIGDDRIAAENLYQHAEHYLRIANAARDGNQQGPALPTASADTEADGEPEHGSDETGERSPIGWGDDRPGFA